MSPVFFADEFKFREWFEKNHNKEIELLVGFYKVGSGKQSMTWSQSVDQALCFGWINGVIRFTPGKPDSVWTAVNIKKRV